VDKMLGLTLYVRCMLQRNVAVIEAEDNGRSRIEDILTQ